MNSYFVNPLKFELQNPNHKSLLKKIKSHYILTKSFKIHKFYAKIIF